MKRGLVTVVVVMAVLAGCGDDDPESAAQPTPTPVTSSPASPSAGPAPVIIEGEQGDKVFGVYLAVAKGEKATAATKAAEAEAARNDWMYAVGELGCDRGAAKALGLDPNAEYFRVAVYFATQAEADRFAEAYEPGGAKVAKATLYCLD